MLQVTDDLIRNVVQEVLGFVRTGPGDLKAAAPMGPAEFTRFVSEQIVVWRPRIIAAGAVEN